ncbi:MAG: hypothetical protein IJZ64_00095 [Ruminococcus sp.]|nr:hypothetical protein [Ruminococcus sp.]
MSLIDEIFNDILDSVKKCNTNTIFTKNSHDAFVLGAYVAIILSRCGHKAIEDKLKNFLMVSNIRALTFLDSCSPKDLDAIGGLDRIIAFADCATYNSILNCVCYNVYEKIYPGEIED